ncbi:MAG TPA: putative quinol monooxygenase [Pirellulales bacterium]|nr:putative quinol monooxygenase [Pirellulales bacterium]
MIYLNVLLTVKDRGNVDRIRGLLAEAAGLSRQEPGCVRFEVYQSQNDSAKFLLTERWESQADLDRHRTAKAYTTIYQPQVMPLVERDGHPSNLVSGE